MQIKLGVLSRVNLETNSIGRDRCKVIIPEESQNPFALLDSRVLRLTLLTIRFTLLAGHSGPSSRETNAQEEDISFLEGNVRLTGNFEDFVQRNLVLCECIDADALLLGVADVVD